MKGQTFIKQWIAGVVMLIILITMNTCSRNAELALEEGFQINYAPQVALYDP